MRKENRYGKRTREIRCQHGWTQEHLAEVAGITVRTVQRVEPPVPKRSWLSLMHSV